LQHRRTQVTRQRLASSERLLVSRQQQHPIVIVENALVRASRVADQRIEGVHELKLRRQRAPAALSQRFLLDVGLSHPLLRPGLHDPALAIHVALHRCRHEAESQRTIEPIRGEVLANRIGRALREYSRHAPAVLLHDHVQRAGAARSTDRDGTVRQNRNDGCIVERRRSHEQRLARHRRRRSTLGIHDAHVAVFEHQRSGMSFVDRAVHPCVQLHDRPVEARCDAHVASNRVADHDALDAEPIHQRL